MEVVMQSAVLERVTTTAPQKAGRQPALKHLALCFAALALTLGVGWYGTDWWRNGRFVESTDDSYVGGEVTALSPHVAGFVAAVLVADNERVRRGQVLLRLDPRDFQAALARARLQRVADRRRDFLDRCRLARRGTGVHLPGAQIRHALAVGVRARLVWACDVDL
jgi:multidrug resistance efflux pump